MYVIRLVQVKEMPRKPARRRRRQLLRPLPFSFSPFSRTVSQVASYCKVNHQIHVSKLDRKSPPNAAGIIVLLIFFSYKCCTHFCFFKFPSSLCEIKCVTPGNRFINHTLEEKSARSESSEEDSSEVSTLFGGIRYQY